MRFLARRTPQRSLMSVAACLFLVAAFQGCTGNGSQVDRDADAQGTKLAKLAGRVTVDGQPPAEDTTLVVILNDPEHLDATANGKRPTLFTVCDPEGNFAIMTQPGKYIVTFAELHQAETHGSGPKPIGRGRGPGGQMRQALGPPDDLKNLYNDPDKNATDEKFKLNLQMPGQDNYQVDLAVAGKEPVAKPAPHAVTQILPRT